MDPCASFSQGRQCTGPLTVLRFTPKEMLPFKERGPALTTYMMDYINPNLVPSYNRGLPCTSTCCPSVGPSNKNVQSNRTDITGNRMRRKFLFGRLPCDNSPFPDVAAAGKVIKWKRLCEDSYILPTNVDRSKRVALREFHERCVNFRDFYVDKTDTLNPDPFFDVGQPWPVRCPVDEREFKTARFEDGCNLPQHLGPRFRCAALPCLKDRGRGVIKPIATPKPCLPSWPLPQVYETNQILA